MSQFTKKVNHKKNKIAGGITETTRKFTGSRRLELTGKVQSPEADLKKNIYAEDKVVDIRDVIARKINDKIDRNEKQMDLAYWANVNNIGNSQISLHPKESMPEIYTIKKIYMSIVMGRIVMRLNDQGEKIYLPGSVIDVPGRTKMKIKNVSSDKTAILALKL